MFDRDVSVGFTADASGYTSSMDQMITSMTQFTAGADGVIGKIGKVNNLMLSGVKSLSALSGTNKIATAEAAKYQQQLSKIEVTSKLTNKNYGELSKVTKAFAKDFPIGMGQAVKQVEALQESGVTSTKEIKALGKAMTQLGAATGTFGPDLTKDMVQLSRTFGNSTDSIGKFGDSLAQVTAQYGANAGAVTSFSKAIAPIASTVGMSETSVIGLSTAFSRLGEDGFGAANAFNKVMMEMNRSIREGTPEAKHYAEVMGMSADQLKDMWKSNPTEGFITFVEAIKAQGPDAIRSLEMLGFEGVRTTKSLTALTQSGDVREIVSAAQKSYGGGAAASGAEEAFGGVNDQLSKLGENMQQTTAAAGTPMLGFMEKMLKVANSLASGLNSLANSPGMQLFAKILGVGGIAVGGAKAITAIATTGSMVQTMLKGVGANKAAEQFMLGRTAPSMIGPDASRMARAGAAATNFFGPAMPGPWYQAPMRGAARIGRGSLNAYAAWTMMNTNMIRTAMGDDVIRTPQGQRIQELGRMGRTIAGERSIPADIRRQMLKEIAGESGRMAGDYMRQSGASIRAAGSLGQQTVAAGRWVGGVGGRALGSAASAIGTGAMGLIGGTAGAAMLGVGALGYGAFKAYQGKQRNEEAEKEGMSNANRMFNDMAEKAGIASKGLVSFTQALAESASKVAAESKTAADAMTVTGKEIATAMSPGYEAPIEIRQNAGIKEWFTNKEEDPRKEAIRMRGILGENASPEAINTYQMAMIKTVGPEFAKAVTKEFEAVQKMSSEEIEAALRGEGGKAGMGPWSTKEKEEFTELAAGEKTRRMNIENEMYGTENATVLRLKEATDALADLEGKFKPGSTDQYGRMMGGSMGPAASKELDRVVSSLGMDAEQAKKFKGAYTTSGGKGDMADLLRKAGMEDLALTYEQKREEGMDWEGTSTAELKKGMVSEREKEMESQVKGYKALGVEMGSLGTDIAGLGKVVRESGAKSFDEWAKAGMEGANELQKAYAELKQTPGSSQAQQKFANEAAKQALKDAGGSATKAKQAIIAAMTTSTGEEMPGLQLALRGVDRSTAVQDVGANQWKLSSEKIVAGRQSQQRLDAGEYKTEEEKTGLQATADEGLQADIARQQQMLSFIKQMDSMRTQLARSNEDYNTTVSRSNRNFYQQQEWQAADFYKQRRWQQEDFQRSMQRSEADYHTSRQRAARDFNKQVTRMSEEAAKTMFNPYERIQPRMVVDTGMLSQSLLEQNESVQEQLAGVKKLGKMGLSKDAIDQLQLMDPSQGAQVQRLLADAAEDPSALKRLNALIKDRLKAGADLTKNEYNKSFQNMKKDFKTSMNDMADDFDKNMKRQRQDYGRSMERSLEQFKTSQSRSATLHSQALSDMASDHSKAQSRAKEDMQKLADYFTKEYVDVQKQFLKDLASLPDGMSDATYKAVVAVLEAEAKAVGDAQTAASTAAANRERDRGQTGGTGGGPATNEDLGWTDYTGGGLLDRVVGHDAVPPANGWKARSGGAGFHTGVDYGGGGMPLFAPFSGTMRQGVNSPRWAGNHAVIIPDGGTHGVVLAHMRGFSRGPGRVKRGERVGTSGDTGRSFGAHLHIEVVQGPGFRPFSDAVNPYPYLAKGGIVKNSMLANIGEAGPEAVVPLNRDGARTIADAMVRYLSASDALRTKVGGFASPVTNNIHTYDQRTQFNGPITVQSQNPDEMAHKLSARQRRERLARKVGSAA